MANNSLAKNIGQAVNDFANIKDAIIEKGVNVPGGTPTSEYDGLIRQMRNTPEETPATIKEKYEANADTNAFTDAEKAKLTGIETGAQKNIPSIDKSAVIRAGDWTLQEDETYVAIVYDSAILEDSKCSMMPSDAESYDLFAEAVIFAGTSSAGQLLLKAKNPPSGNISIHYTIGF